MYLLITLVMCSGSVLNVVISVKMFYLTTSPPKWLQVIIIGPRREKISLRGFRQRVRFNPASSATGTS